MGGELAFGIDWVKAVVMRAIVSLCVMGLGLVAVAAYEENFDGYAPGLALTELTEVQWSQFPATASTSAFIRESPSAREGRALALERHGTSVQLRSKTKLWKSGDGAAQFSVDLFKQGKLSAIDVIISQHGSRGFYIDFSGAEVRIGTGGETPFKATYRSEPASLESGKWYTLQIRDLVLPGKNSSGPVVGKIYLFETDNPSNVLLDGVTITASGSGSFEFLDQIDIRRFGGSPGQDVLFVDNLSIKENAK